MNRRHFLSISAGSVALAGCSTIGINPSPLDPVRSDVDLIVHAFNGLMSQLATVHGMTPEMMSTITIAVNDLQTIATQLKSVNTLNDAQPYIQRIESDINSIVSVLARLQQIPQSVSIIIQAANTLLPVIENAVGIVVSPKVALRASAGRMTTEQARNVLRSASK